MRSSNHCRRQSRDLLPPQHPLLAVGRDTGSASRPPVPGHRTAPRDPALEGSDRRLPPARDLGRHDIGEAVGRGDGEQRSHPIGMAGREQRADRPAERGRQDVDRVLARGHRAPRRHPDVLRDIRRGRPGAHQLAAKIAANDGEAARPTAPPPAASSAPTWRCR